MPEVQGHMSPSNDYQMYPILSYSVNTGTKGKATINYTCIMRIRWGPIYWDTNSLHKIECSGQSTQTKSGRVYSSSETGNLRITVCSGSFTYTNNNGGTQTVTLKWYNNNINTSYSGVHFNGLSVSTNITFTISPSTTALSTPGSLSVNTSSQKGGSNITLSWSRVDNATGNNLTKYYIQHNGTGSWTSNGWSASQYNPGSGATSITLLCPNYPGKIVKFRIRAEGSAGSSYYSGFRESSNSITVRSNPTAYAPSISQSNGAFNLSWRKASNGTGNTVSGYTFKVRYRPNSSSSYTTQTIGTLSASSTSNSTNPMNFDNKWFDAPKMSTYRYSYGLIALGSYSGENSSEVWSSELVRSPTYTGASKPTSISMNRYTYNTVSTTTGPYWGQKIKVSWSGGDGGTRDKISIPSSERKYDLQVKLNGGSWTNLTTSTSSSSYSYYTIPNNATSIQFRVRNLSPGGSSYYSDYLESSIIRPTSAPALTPISTESNKINATQKAENGEYTQKVTVSVEGTGVFNTDINNVIASYDFYYMSGENEVDSTNLSQYTYLGNRNSSIRSIDLNDARWNYYYRFAVVAIGQYGGRSEPVFYLNDDGTKSLQIIANLATPCQGVQVTDGVYVDKDGKIWALSKDNYTPYFQVAPYGGDNLYCYYVDFSLNQDFSTLSYSIQVMPDGTSSAHFPTVPEKDEGLYYYIRVRSFPEYAQSTPLEPYFYLNGTDGKVDYINRNELSYRCKIRPIMQIVRANRDVWDREDNRDFSILEIAEEGFRLADGELGYDLDNKILKVGQDNSTFNSLLAVGQNIGLYNSNIGSLNITFGYNNKILNPNTSYSLIVGASNTIINTPTTADSYPSSNIIIGRGNEANYSGNMIGYNLTTSSNNDPSVLICGKYNSTNSVFANSLFVVGSGSSASVRSNAIAITPSMFMSFNPIYTTDEVAIVRGDIDAEEAMSNPLKIKLSEAYNLGSMTFDWKIPNNADFNNYNKPGTYWVDGDKSFSTMLSTPHGTAKSGKLLVNDIIGNGKYNNNFDNPNYIVQTYEELEGNIFRRYKINEDWSYWNRVILGSESSTGAFLKINLPITDSLNNKYAGYIEMSTSALTINHDSAQWVSIDDRAVIQKNLIVGYGGLNQIPYAGRGILCVGEGNIGGGSSKDNYSATIGYNLQCYHIQTVLGKYNYNLEGGTPGTKDGNALIIGNGTNSSERGNSHRFVYDGRTFADGAYSSAGADYAEMFEWEDLNKNNEDRAGRFVTLLGEKIKYASSNDEYILGIVSVDPAIIGDNPDRWVTKFKKDVFGRRIYENKYLEEISHIDEKTGEKTIAQEAGYYDVPILNPDYNPDEEYVDRSDRPEWAYIGMLGKLVVIDDGTCEENGYCWPYIDGIATKDTIHKQIRVMKRLDETHIRVLLK